MSDPIKIQGELTPHPHVCKFHVDRPLVEEGWTLVFNEAGESADSPLVDALFAVEGIRRVVVRGAEITLTKDVPAGWPELAAAVVAAIRAALDGDGAGISAAALEAVRNAPAGDLAERVEELLRTRINPALASHRGFARLVKVEDRDVHLELGGGCQGCASSRATLRFGIENAIREVAPQVRNVVDATDHAAGVNPFYR